ncbi:MAG: hypothetical protein H6711_03805 [Myxococcales bacterium]|nr:hypothetical protein [Myxococcales bacterium]
MTTLDLDALVRRHPANAGILAWIDRGGASGWRLTPYQSSGFDEGGQMLMEVAGARLPDAAKRTIGVHNVCVHPETGVIYAVHHGRYTFLIREPDAPPRTERWLSGIDGDLDLAALEGEWRPTWLEDQEDFDALLAAHAAAGRRPADLGELS